MILIECCEDGYEEDYIAMEKYIDEYGCHLNKKLAEFAINKIIDRHTNFTAWDKEEIDLLLSEYNITLKNNKLYDYVYVANMCKAEYFGKSISTKENVAKFIRDYIDDEGAYDGRVFNRWYADMRKLNYTICWDEM